MEKMKLVKVVKKTDADETEGKYFGDVYAQKIHRYGPGGLIKLSSKEYGRIGMKKLLKNLTDAIEWLKENADKKE